MSTNCLLGPSCPLDTLPEKRWCYRYTYVYCQTCGVKYYETHYDDRRTCPDCRGGIKIYYQVLPQNIWYEYYIPRKKSSGWSTQQLYSLIANNLNCPCHKLEIEGIPWTQHSMPMLCPMEFESEPSTIFKVHVLD